MLDYVWPTLFALFVWWFSTGLIIYLDGLPTRTFRWSLLAATALLGASVYGLYVSASDASVSGAYCAFACGLSVWGWLEITFYMGALTGPRKVACENGCSGWVHFGHAVQVSLYHEIAILVAAGVVAGLTWNGANQTGLWTFVVLWWMHQSARLNVFLGVPNLNEHFLPAHLAYLKSFFRLKPMNLLFPVSVTASTVALVLLVQKVLAAAPASHESTCYILLSAIMALALIEHWFLVLPLPFAALWNWSLHTVDKAHDGTAPLEAAVGGGVAGPSRRSTAALSQSPRPQPQRPQSQRHGHPEGCLSIIKAANGRQV